MPRPRKSEKEKKQDISIKADPSLVADVENIAVALDLPISLVGRKLIARGLAAYLRDGQLNEPDAQIVVRRVEEPARQLPARRSRTG